MSRSTRTRPELLIVGTLGGGGIHRYVEEQRRHLDDELSVDVYDMYSDPGGEGAIWFLRSFLLAALAALRFPFRSPPDVVHVHTSQRYSFVRASYYVFVAAYLWRRPVVVHVHGSSFDEFVDTDSLPMSWLQSAVFAASDTVLVLSDYWEDALADRIPREKLRVLPNAVDPDDYDPSPGGTPQRIVFVSHLTERKGVPELIAAVDDLYGRDLPDVRVSIAGKGPLAPEVEALASEHDGVEYLGYVSEAEKRALMDDGSIFVLPTYAEGLPIAMLEGMAGGNAVVSTRVAAIPEVIGSDNGILVEPGDPDALADALAELVADPDRVEQMGRRNRALIEQRYSWEAATETLLDVYESELGRRLAAPA